MNLYSPLIFIAILGLLVFVHELGHFLAAKSVGVAVEEFAFGFGPRLVTLFRRSGTEYTIHALPLGGFVNLVGMQPEEAHLQNGLMSKPAWARAFVFLAGPLMNVLLAILVYCSMGMLTGLPTGLSNEVVEVHKDTEAARVGLQTGDRIVRLNERVLRDGSELIDAIASHPGQNVTLIVERGGKTIQIAARPTPETQVLPWIRVESVEPNGPSAQLGLKKGDRLVSFNGEPIATSLPRLQRLLNRARPAEREDDARKEPFTLTFLQEGREIVLRTEGPPGDLRLRDSESPLAKRLGLEWGDRIVTAAGQRIRSQENLGRILHDNDGRPVILSVQRGSGPVTLPPQVVPVELANPDQVRTRGKMGFLPGYQFRDKLGFSESVTAGWESFLGFFAELYNQIASRKLLNNAGSIITMGRAVDLYSKLPPGHMLHLIASLSLSLAVFNLLPIPVLDGGHLALLSVEVIRRRRLGPAAYRMATAIGFAVVLLAFVLLMYFDVVRWRSGAPLINL